MLRIAGIITKVEVNCSVLHWPSRDEARSYPGPGCSREYEDLRGITWLEVEETLGYESRELERHAADQTVVEECEDDDSVVEAAGYLMGLDLGVASSVLALSAAQCVTFSSCNGGALGDFHHEQYPLVTFFSRRKWIPVLLECTKKSGVGLENQNGGALQLYADDLRKMVAFAKELLARKNEFSEPKRPKSTSRGSSRPRQQLL